MAVDHRLTRDAVTITERLELAVGPRVQDPVSGVQPGMLGLVLRLIPVVLDLGDQRILVVSSGVLGLDALLLKVTAQLLGIPAVIRSNGMVIPVVGHEFLQILAVSGRRVGNVVVGEPALQLSLMPSVVGW